YDNIHHLPSFPTRRSSDLSCSMLGAGEESMILETKAQERGEGKAFASRSKTLSSSGRKRTNAITSGRIEARMPHSHHSCMSTSRSEEHTSELQSLRQLVCR